MFNKKERDDTTSQVIVDERIVSVADLKRKASRANARFWALSVSMAMVASTVLPYMSLAATIASSDSKVFTGNVVPGYSMGGLKVTAYGVDLNSWGKISNDTVVGSTYGIWSGERLKSAKNRVTSSGSTPITLLNKERSANYNLTESDKSAGWEAITGRTGYTLSNPDGSTSGGDTVAADSVAPYRTTSDYNFWDSRKPTSSNSASASIEVSLFPDFVIVTLDKNGRASIVQSPDEINTGSKGDNMALFNPHRTSDPSGNNTAVPYYVPLSALFEIAAAHNPDFRDPTKATMSNLLAWYAEHDPYGDTLGAKISSGKFTLGDDSTTYKINLLNGTQYSPTNSSVASGDSDAFNPYPYSMIFSTTANESGTSLVVSSLYNNSEAYVYFSPASVYTTYMSVRAEYESIKAGSSSSIRDNGVEITKTLQLGYYAAAMAILEAYLDEALPQDMTRGYVGPSEHSSVANSIASSNTGAESGKNDRVPFAGDGHNNNARLTDSVSASSFRSVSYSTIMYDVARGLQGGYEYHLGETNAIMDTLSVFGYANTESTITTGVMKGMNRNTAFTHYNIFTPYQQSSYYTNAQNYNEHSDDSSGGASGGASGSSGSSGGIAGVVEGIQGGAADFINAGLTAITGGSDSKKQALENSVEARRQWMQNVKSSMSTAQVLWPSYDDGNAYSVYAVPTGDDSGENVTYAYYNYDTGLRYKISSNTNLTGQSNYELYSTFETASTYSAAETAAYMVQTHSEATSGISAKDDIEITTVPISQAYARESGTTGSDDVEVTTVSIPKATADDDATDLWGWLGELFNQGAKDAAKDPLEGITNLASQYVEAATPGKEGRTAGVYIPSYYPIQQHLMPSIEKGYRFQILATVPYEVLISYIRNYGFASGVSLSYASGDGAGGISKFKSIVDAQDRLASLAAQYEQAETSSMAAGLFLSNVYSAADASPEEEKDKNTTNISRMVSLHLEGGSAEGYSREELRFKDSTNVELNDRITVTAARIDSALIAYAASSMNADNVHDMFDIVRSTNYLKAETWYRFYNPIKSEGGDTDLFVTRVSPAQTTYMPAVLFNGYTAAGGASIEPALTTYNCSFDYYSTPSFAPCFASHTIDSCYYGVLNYEQRAFYSKGFIMTLSDTAGIPSVEAYLEKVDQLNAMKDAEKAEAVVMWKDVGTLFIMGKRLAYICAANDIASKGSMISYGEFLTAARKANWSSRYLQAGWVLLRDGPNGLDGIDNDHPLYPWNEDGKEDEAWKQLEQDNVIVQAQPEAIDSDLKFSGSGLVYEPEDSDNYGKLTEWNADWYHPFNSLDNGSAGRIDANDPLPIQITGYHGYTSSDPVKIRTGGNGDAFANSIYFSIIYDRYFQRYLGEGGKYYWVDWEEAKSRLPNLTLAESSTTGGAIDKKEKEYKHAISFDSGLLKGLFPNLAGAESMNDKEIIQGYEDAIKEAAKEISTAVINMAKDIDILTAAMPDQMQNCLAWADYQNSSDSENQYQNDPADSNITINVQDNTTKFDTAAIESNGILGEADLKKYGLELQRYNNDTENLGAVIAANTGTNAAGEMQSKMTRGVEGSTWTSTIQPAAYSMSATIARVDTLSLQSGTNYPYSGLANGRLQSGTDKYAVMQAHVIDYTSIASGIAGDLSTRQRAKVVAVSNPEYSSITDFLDVLGNLGALFAELGTSLLNITSSGFSAMMFPAENTTMSLNNATAVETAPTAAAASAVYTTKSGITMNRLPASARSFDSGSGELSAATLSISSGMPTASAKIPTAVSISSSWARLKFLYIDTSFYSLMQTFGLTLVMVFIGFIAFRNFYAYSISNSKDMVVAQTQLKVVLPRAILAIFMIGLPPIAGYSSGFEGGNFLLLQLIGNVIDYVCNIFISMEGDALISAITAPFTGNLALNLTNIGFYFLFFVFIIIMAVFFIIGMIFIFLQMLILAGFYLVGPIVWSFYVWPYNALDHKEGTSKRGDGSAVTGILDAVTKRMNFGTFTAHRAGNLAPLGLVFNYTVLASVTIGWILVFWVTTMVFLGTSGFADSGAATASAALNSTGYPTASASVVTNSIFHAFGFDGPDETLGKWLFSLVITFICFFVMIKMMFTAFKDTAQFQKTVAGKTGAAIKNALSPQNLAGVASIGLDVLSKTPGGMDIPNPATGAGGVGGKIADVAKNTDLAKELAEKAKDVASGVGDKGKAAGALGTAGALIGAAAGQKGKTTKAEGAIVGAQAGKDTKPVAGAGKDTKSVAGGTDVHAAKSADAKGMKARPTLASGKSLESEGNAGKTAGAAASAATPFKPIEAFKKGGLKGLAQGGLSWLSNPDNATKALNTVQAAKTVGDNIAKGNFLGAGLDALGARTQWKSNREIGEAESKKALNDETSKALEAISKGEAAFDDFDPEIRKRLAPFLDQDRAIDDEGLAKAQATLAKANERLDTQISQRQVLTEMKQNVLGAFDATGSDVGKDIARAMGGAHALTASEAQASATHDERVDSLMAARGLDMSLTTAQAVKALMRGGDPADVYDGLDDAVKGELVERGVVNESGELLLDPRDKDSRRQAKGIVNELQAEYDQKRAEVSGEIGNLHNRDVVAAVNALDSEDPAEQRAAYTTAVNTAYQMVRGLSPDVAAAFIQEEYGEGCTDTEWASRERRRMSGEVLSQQDLKEMVSFEVQSMLSGAGVNRGAVDYDARWIEAERDFAAHRANMSLEELGRQWQEQSGTRLYSRPYSEKDEYWASLNTPETLSEIRPKLMDMISKSEFADYELFDDIVRSIENTAYTPNELMDELYTARTLTDGQPIGDVIDEMAYLLQGLRARQFDEWSAGSYAYMEGAGNTPISGTLMHEQLSDYVAAPLMDFLEEQGVFTSSDGGQATSNQITEAIANLASIEPAVLAARGISQVQLDKLALDQRILASQIAYSQEVQAAYHDEAVKTFGEAAVDSYEGLDIDDMLQQHANLSEQHVSDLFEGRYLDGTDVETLERQRADVDVSRGKRAPHDPRPMPGNDRSDESYMLPSQRDALPDDYWQKLQESRNGARSSRTSSQPRRDTSQHRRRR